MERTLGLMCGAGVLPARAAQEARRQGYRVVAFTFVGEPPGLAAAVERLVPSRIADTAAVLQTLLAERASAALFSGAFGKRELLAPEGAEADASARDIVTRGDGSLGDRGLAQGVVTTLTALGIEVLDQRPFFGAWLAEAGPLGARGPSDDERAELTRGLDVARALASTGAGQTVVCKRGIVAALEGMDGTSETIRRGLALAGPGAVVVKAVARDNDYRFDLPSVGVETMQLLAAGGATALAVEAGRVVVLDRERALPIADAAGIAVVGTAASEGAGALRART